MITNPPPELMRLVNPYDESVNNFTSPSHSVAPPQTENLQQNTFENDSEYDGHDIDGELQYDMNFERRHSKRGQDKNKEGDMREEDEVEEIPEYTGAY
jgi:hypothetical protein